MRLLALIRFFLLIRVDPGLKVARVYGRD